MKIFIPRVMFVKNIFWFFLIFYCKYKTKLSKNNEVRSYKNPKNCVAICLWYKVPKWNIVISNIKMKAKLKLVLEICSYFLNLNIKVLIGREINFRECIEMFIR